MRIYTNFWLQLRVRTCLFFKNTKTTLTLSWQEYYSNLDARLVSFPLGWLTLYLNSFSGHRTLTGEWTCIVPNWISLDICKPFWSLTAFLRLDLDYLNLLLLFNKFSVDYRFLVLRVIVFVVIVVLYIVALFVVRYVVRILILGRPYILFWRLLILVFLFMGF